MTCPSSLVPWGGRKKRKEKKRKEKKRKEKKRKEKKRKEKKRKERKELKIVRTVKICKRFRIINICVTFEFLVFVSIIR